MFGIPMNVIMIAILWEVNVCYVLVFMLYALHFKSLSLRCALCLVVKVSYLDITTKNPELFTKEAPAGLWTQILILESLTSKKRHKRNRVSWATRIPRKLLFSYLDKLFLELCSLILIRNIHFGTLTSPEIYVLHTHL